MPASRTKPSLTSLLALVLIVSPFVYVLSYAPVMRIGGRTVEVPWLRSDAREHATLYPAYQPVDWLIDNTPLREPLFYWAEIWGVRDQFRRADFLRSLDTE